MAKQPIDQNEKPFDVSKIHDELEVLAASTPLPAHQGLQKAPRPTDFAPPAVRNGAAKSRTQEELRAAGQKTATDLANQYLAAAAAIEQTGIEYKATQNALAAKLISMARELEADGEDIAEHYKNAADTYRARAVALSTDIELALGKSDKAIALCHEMIKVLAATENMK